MKIIMGVQIGNRSQDATKVQELLTKHGCIIKTRLGVHDVSKESCSTSGLIVLEFIRGVEPEVYDLENELSTLDDVTVKTMEFE